MVRPVSILLLSGAAIIACGGSDGPEPHVFPEGGYQHLSETGLYDDIITQKLSKDVRPYSVAHVLWSDGSEKERWVRLPRGSKIDTTDMDHWQLPVGAQLFKQFTRDGVRIETRLIERIANTGVRDRDFWVGAFLWEEDESDATFVEDGAADARGTEHDVPAQLDCWRCHRGTPGNILGFGAIQLSHDGPGTTLAALADMKLLSEAPARAAFAPPGDESTSRALGYLHANCGHCHNPAGLAWIDSNMVLDLSIDEERPQDTAIYQTTVGIELQFWRPSDPAVLLRVDPGSPETSALISRMSERGDNDAMPPLATELPHSGGLDLIESWIRGL